MYKNKKIIGIIPARGGSKGIPRKNIVDLGGYPLIAWTIIRAKKSSLLDDVILTTEDQEIIYIAEQFKCSIPFKRPDEYATDIASSVDVTLHALNALNIKDYNTYFVLLQPTSPFRSTETIDKSIKFAIDNNYPYVMSVSNLKKSPYHIYIEKKDNLLEPLYKKPASSTRRQDLPNAVISNGVIYVANAKFFLREKSFKPSMIRYFKIMGNESFDIDTPNDLKYAREIVEKNKIKP